MFCFYCSGVRKMALQMPTCVLLSLPVGCGFLGVGNLKWIVQCFFLVPWCLCDISQQHSLTTRAALPAQGEREVGQLARAEDSSQMSEANQSPILEWPLDSTTHMSTLVLKFWGDLTAIWWTRLSLIISRYTKERACSSCLESDRVTDRQEVWRMSHKDERASRIILGVFFPSEVIHKETANYELLLQARF